MKIACEARCPIKVVTAEQMRELDRRATEEFGVPSITLMENAGRAVARVATEMLGNDLLQKSILVLCGPGNNGGDGFVAARYLRDAGAGVNVAYYGDRTTAKGDALANIEIAEAVGLSIEHNPLDDEFWDSVSRVDLVIDALLGTGAKGDLREPFGRVMARIPWIMLRGAKLLAVDIASGVDADTGVVASGVGPRPHATVTFALPKVGLLTNDGSDYAGDLTIADIGIPHRALIENDCRTRMLSACSPPEQQPPCAPGPFLRRDHNSHKGTFGHTAIVAGSVGMTGAATLSAEGALRIGTGLVTLLVPESLNDIMEAKVTEAMTVPVPQGDTRAFGMASLDKVLEYVSKWNSAVIGPGFGRDNDTMAFTLELIKRLEQPAIIDADALYAVSTDLSVLSSCEAPLVITPHPGEMATLLGTSAAAVQSNRLEVARTFAQEHGVTVVLKGAGTVVAAPDGNAYINTTGSPGMATGGTGDVLSGMIGGLLAQKLEPVYAATSAVYLHGLAGEIAAEKLGEAAMLAGDLADNIGEAIKRVISSQ